MTAASPTHSLLRPEEQDFLDGLIRKHQGQPGMLLAILEAVQERQANHYLQPEVLEYIAARTGIPGSQIYGVVTFYALFNLRPQASTRCASAAARLATHADRERCWSA